MTYHETSFEEACGWWPDMEYIWTPLGRPDHMHTFNVLWSGEVLAQLATNRRTEQWSKVGALFTVLPGGSERVDHWRLAGHRHDDNGFRQGWASPDAPVLWTDQFRDGLHVRSEVFACTADGQAVTAGDEPLYAWLRLSFADAIEALPIDDPYLVTILIERPPEKTGMVRRRNVVFGDDRAYPGPLRASRRSYSPRHGLSILDDAGNVRLAIAPQQACRTTFDQPTENQPGIVCTSGSPAGSVRRSTSCSP